MSDALYRRTDTGIEPIYPRTSADNVSYGGRSVKDKLDELAGITAKSLEMLPEGVDLKTVFADAAALHAAISVGDFSKIHVGDYWPISLTGTYRDVGAYTCPAGTALYSDTGLTMAAGTAAAKLEAKWINDSYCEVNSEGVKYCVTNDCLAYFERALSNAVLKMEVAGINTYRCYGDSGNLLVGTPHLLLLSRDCLPHYLRFRKANLAWHVAPNAANGIGVWQGSALYTTINDEDYGILSLVAETDVGAYIYAGPNEKGMRYYGEMRASETAASSTSAWLSRGRLFIPTEQEIWGREIFASCNGGGHIQLPVFSGSYRHIIKKIGDGGSVRASWWSMSAQNGSANHISSVIHRGYPACTNAMSAGQTTCVGLILV